MNRRLKDKLRNLSFARNQVKRIKELMDEERKRPLLMKNLRSGFTCVNFSLRKKSRC